MMIPKLTAREKKIAYVVGFMFTLLVGFHGVWTPMQNKFSELEDQIFAMEMKVRKAKTFIRQKDDVAELSKKYTNLEKMDAGTDEEEIARLLNFIEQTARKNNVSLSDVKPEAVQSDKITKRYTVLLSAEAQLSALVDYIHELQNSEQLLKLERVDIAPKEDQSAILRSNLVVTRVVVK